jgi:hypothetical protein
MPCPPFFSLACAVSLAAAIACRPAANRGATSDWPPPPPKSPAGAACFAVAYEPDVTPLVPPQIALVDLESRVDSGAAFWLPSVTDTVSHWGMYGTWRWSGTGRDSVAVRFSTGFDGSILVFGIQQPSAGHTAQLRGGRAMSFSDVLSNRPGPSLRLTSRALPCSST